MAKQEQPARKVVDLPIYGEGAYDYDECVSIAGDIKYYK